ncbi:hypothetical protein [Amycolatopsis sp. NPDC059021]|uniref:hypothetical protein n=1 Tax=Amycolatopsis sp. NPDC059021 TaxID=3346704 RepID=UPI00366E2F96
MRKHWGGKPRLLAAGLTVAAVTLSAAPASAAPRATWPGAAQVAVADGSNVFGSNLSGLSFQSPSVLWAVKNGPGTLYRLVPDGKKWRPDPSGGWAKGKQLRYQDGSGDPDAEGVVVTPEGVFAATERDNDNGDESRMQVLRFDPASSASTLNATAEWDLTKDLPSVSPNKGLEGISWVPDSFLTAHKFRDEHTKAAYDPAKYPGHGGGLYFVGLEDNGTIYAYALGQNGSYTRVATITSGLPAVMDLEFEPSTGHLWAVCDDNCDGRSTTLDITAQGKFAVGATYDRPSGMSNYNNEGFAIAPQEACASGRKPVVWSDDDNDGGHALRSSTLPCK